MDILLLIQAAATWALTGLIWTIQVVHYPLLAGIDRQGYPAWQREHMRRITLVVAPLMIVEFASAGALLALAVTGRAPLPAGWAAAGMLLVGLIWLSTLLLQAPLHGRLTDGFDVDRHRRLVRTNWLRTLMWSARAVLVAAMLR